MIKRALKKARTSYQEKTNEVINRVLELSAAKKASWGGFIYFCGMQEIWALPKTKPKVAFLLTSSTC